MERAATEAAARRKRRRWPKLTIDLGRRDHRRKLLLVFLAFSLVGANP